MKKVYVFICRAESYIAQSCLAIIVALVFIAAVSRTIGKPIVWSVDLATFLFAWCTFLSADVALRNDKLVRVEVFANAFPEKFQDFLMVLNYVIIFVFLTALIGYGTYHSYFTRFRVFQGIPGFSYTWVTLSVPVGCTLMLITTALKITAIVRKIKSSRYNSQPLHT